MHVGENIGEVSFHSYISGKFRILFWVSHEIDDSQSSLATCSSNLEPFSNEDRAPFERGSIGIILGAALSKQEKDEIEKILISRKIKYRLFNAKNTGNSLIIELEKISL